MMDNEPKKFQFAAIDRVLVEPLPSDIQKKVTGKYVIYGEYDNYLNYAWDVYQDSTTLQAVVGAYINYVVGDGIEGVDTVNPKGEMVEDLIYKLITDYVLFGAFALQVVRDYTGKVSTIYHTDVRYLRSDEDNEVFWFNKDFGKRYGRTSKSIVLPKFVTNSKEPNSILYVKNPQSRNTYPELPWKSAMKSVVTESKISNYNLNQITNGFSASYLISLLNGIPNDEEKAQIEKEFTEKFTGDENAGRIMLSFSNGKDTAAEVQKLDVENFKDKFEALAKWCRQDVLTVYGINGNLLGIATENLGFNSEEYESSFRLFNRTRVKPIQDLLIRVFDRLGYTLNFKPFTLN